MVVIRRARAADWPAVRRISARIWGGRDYVPLFFRAWLRQPGFFVAEERGRVVGWNKATELTPRNWWLEALRVDPARRGQGIAWELFCHVRAWVLQQRPESLRLSTADVNKATVHMNRAMGFRLMSRPRFYYGPAPESGPGPDPVVPPAAEALRFLLGNRELRATRGLLGHTWQFVDADRKYAAEMRRRGWMRGVRQGGRLHGLLIVRPHRYDPENLDIAFIGGAEPAQAILRGYIARLAAERGSRYIYGMAAGAEMGRAFTRLGMKQNCRIGRVLVYEYRAGRGSGPPAVDSPR